MLMVIVIISMTYIWWQWCWYIENVYHILYITYTQQVGGAAQHGQEGQPEEEECSHAQHHGHFLRIAFGHTQPHAQYHGHFLNMDVDRKANEKKKNLLMLSIMGTFWRLDLRGCGNNDIAFWLGKSYLTLASLNMKKVKRYKSENINGLCHATTVISSLSKRTNKKCTLIS